MKNFVTLIAILCAVAASATENMTVIANGLRGPVKSCKSVGIGYGHEYLEFDRQGRVIKEINAKDMTAVYKWNDDGTVNATVTDKDGNLVGAELTYGWMKEKNSFIFVAGENRFVGYNDDGNSTLLQKVVVADGKTAVYNYIYDEDGHLIGCKVVSPDNTAPEMEMTVTTEDYDEHGNPARATATANGQDYTSMYKYTYYE